LGALNGGEGTSWYRFNFDTPGTWWLDFPYASDFKWNLARIETPGDLLLEGIGSGSLKFEGLSTGEYILVLNAYKNTENKKWSGRLLNPGLVVTQGLNEGSSGSPKILGVDTQETLHLGGGNFDCRSWYAFTPGDTGWQDFVFGEAGTGSYNFSIYAGDPKSEALITWSNCENQTQGIKLTPGRIYYLEAVGVFSSGVKPCAWPLVIRSGAMPSYKNLNLETWNPLTLSPGGGRWYRFSVTPGQWYLLRWDDKTQGSGTATADVRVSAYGKDRSQGIFYYKDKGYITRWVVQALPDEGEIYCYVQGYSQSSSGNYSLRADRESGSLGVVVQ